MTDKITPTMAAALALFRANPQGIVQTGTEAVLAYERNEAGRRQGTGVVIMNSTIRALERRGAIRSRELPYRGTTRDPRHVQRRWRVVEGG